MQYKFGSLIYIILLEYLKLQYGDFLLFSIVMIIVPMKFFLNMEIALRNQHGQAPFNILHLKIVFFCHVFCFSFPIIFILNIVLFIYSVDLQCLIYLIGQIRYFLYLREGRKLLITKRFVVFDIFDRPGQVFFVLDYFIFLS